jgi:hypothetical protein
LQSKTLGYEPSRLPSPAASNKTVRRNPGAWAGRLELVIKVIINTLVAKNKKFKKIENWK